MSIMKFITTSHVASLLIIILTYYYVNGQRPNDAPVAASIPLKTVVPNLPPNHYQFWLRNHPKSLEEFKEICSQAPNPMNLSALKYFQSLHSNVSLEDPRYLTDFEYGKSVLATICSKIDSVPKSCWGYENKCDLIYLMPECDGSAKDEQKQKRDWFNQADFGYILERRKEMNKYCSPVSNLKDPNLSSLECTKSFKTCRGNNLYIYFDQISKNGSLIDSQKSYQAKEGNIGGWGCDLQLKRIKEEGGEEGTLKSWFTELKNYNINTQPKGKCDVTIEKEAFIIKLDSPSNMYNYLGNFINLYATIHLNNKFSDDNQVIIWDNKLPKSKFNQMWSAFSKNPLKSIGDFDGKLVCFKKFIFTLLPRTVNGLYHQTSLVPGCSKTGLFDAFSKHTLHRLNISLNDGTKSHKENGSKIIKVTIVKRSKSFRKILNEDELVEAAKTKLTNFQIDSIDYETLNFQEQITRTYDTDILVGIHGASLTSLLFLPDWAALIELHDCGDSKFRDLARLRGIRYFNGNKVANFSKKLPVEDKRDLEDLYKKKLVNHDKFSDYKVDANKFLILLEEVADKVRLARGDSSADIKNKKSTQTSESESINKKKSSIANMEAKTHEEL